MNGIIEVALVSLILAIVFFHSAALNWLKTVGKTQIRFAVVILVCVMLGQILNASRTTFPFVRWSMYTEPFENEPIVVCKFEVVLADGSKEKINPTRLFPSLSRNMDQTLGHIFQLRAAGKLNQQQQDILDDLLISIGNRYRESAAIANRTQVVEVHGLLQQVVVTDGVCSIQDTVVAQVRLPGTNKAVQLSSKG